METGSGTTSSESGGFVPNQLAILVPTFDPSKDDVQVFSQKVNLLLNAWPDGKYTELATRLRVSHEANPWLHRKCLQQIADSSG